MYPPKPRPRQICGDASPHAGISHCPRSLSSLDPVMAAIIAPLPVYSPSSRYHRASRPRSSSPSNFPSACDIFFPFSHWCGCRSGHAPSAPPSASPLVRLLRCLELYIQHALPPQHSGKNDGTSSKSRKTEKPTTPRKV
jgi:hypothetical protein